ncbi:MAG: protocatechuate 3,4-dioxygenase subunit alpha [Betaproteobacteria bacterium]|nr:protocatechuate 3,4-dioxygenase subunit alpha [Betaproteobacteria bacterium]MSQ89600.1 protocatechuate 3,4-dioxygenase subunit alpha [Betaproteobacteria bacterium]
MSLQASTSQTVGPYLHIGLSWLITENLAPAGVAGERLSIEGLVIDGDGKPINDALVEIWQANAAGKYAHPQDRQAKPVDPGFRGFGRSATDDQGRFRFHTIKPGRLPGPGGKLQAPHLAVNLFMRGQLKQLVSRIYFPGEPANAEDPVLALVPAERRETLIAKPLAGQSAALEWNVILQGRDETVFFDC